MKEGVISASNGNVVLDEDGVVVEGGHEISQNDFVFMSSELAEQGVCLVGRLMQLIEAVGMSDKQEKAFKRFVKKEVWERFNDFEACMFKFKKGEKYDPRLMPQGSEPVEAE